MYIEYIMVSFGKVHLVTALQHINGIIDGIIAFEIHMNIGQQ